PHTSPALAGRRRGSLRRGYGPRDTTVRAGRELGCGLASIRRIRNMSGRERALDSTRYAVRLGKARTHEIERHHYEARAEHEPTRPNHIEVEIERTLQHPQRRDAGLDAKRNRLSDER